MSPHTTSSLRHLGGANTDRAHWLELPGHRTSVRTARRFVSARLSSWRVPEDACANAVLLVSELATNAVLHTFSLRILCGIRLLSDAGLRLEVHDRDDSARRLPRRAPGPDDECGRGLLLVQEIADSWGVVPSPLTGGNAVWANLATGL
ncbi:MULTISPECIES: ATP-binding protein [Streptomyces]|uniref:ATP-binding protein n=1 Tax=Streptomyces argyrophylli TaxID=2726118 RepID=A0A6M4PMV3_9ACTN|nr:MULTISPECIES: ATP-binding protein [Streptomyces]QJS12301.1 ATP-binding protein [Streptomyces argyrophyllae]